MLPDFPFIIADESVDGRIIRSLVAHGFLVYSISDEAPGITDDQVIEIAIKKNGYIITEDKDFGDILIYNNQSGHRAGSMLLRIFDLTPDLKTQLIIETLLHHAENLVGCFAVLTSKKLRIRRYSS